MSARPTKPDWLGVVLLFAKSKRRKWDRQESLRIDREVERAERKQKPRPRK